MIWKKKRFSSLGPSYPEIGRSQTLFDSQKTWNNFGFQIIAKGFFYWREQMNPFKKPSAGKKVPPKWKKKFGLKWGRHGGGNKEIPYIEAHLILMYLKLDLHYAYVLIDKVCTNCAVKKSFEILTSHL